MTRIMADPGHGGRDPGAIGRDPFTVREKDVAWTVATLVRGFLPACTVATTRRQGEFVSLHERAKRANDFNAVGFLSIHCNAVADPKAHGVEVWHHPSSVEGRALADCILRAMLSAPLHGPALENRGLKPSRRLVVLKKTRMPAVLVELPFLSNAQDLTTLIEPCNQIALAQAIAEGTMNWLQV